METLKSDKEYCETWTQFQHGLEYKRQIYLQDTIIRNVDFYEGRQWDYIAEKLKEGLPRPVFNIVKNICRIKKSGILGSPVSLVFDNYKDDNNSQILTHFVKYLLRELGQTRLDDMAINDGVKKGTYIYHYYYDSEAKGINSGYKGGIRGEIIDILNFFVENPIERDEQKQKWIIISSRLPIDAAKAMADSEDKAKLVSDEEEETQNYKTQTKQQGNETCIVLTKYFRVDGEVYVEKSVRAGVICEARPLTPNLERVTDDIEPDTAESGLPDDTEKETAAKSAAKSAANLYPVVVGQYDTREQCIFGISEVEGLIPNQIAVNFDISMQILATQNMAWSKWKVKPGALKGQTITNRPGEILTEHVPDGIQRINGEQMNNSVLNLVNTIVDLTRNVTGANDVMSGEVGNNMSGVAIAQLQAQAIKPIEDLRNNFWRVYEKIGAVLVQFCKTHYCDKKYEFTFKERDRNMAETFDGKVISEENFEVNVTAGAGSQYSEILVMSALNDLLKAEIIDKKTYVSMFPESAMPNQQEIIDNLNEQEQGQIQQIVQQLQMLQQQVAANETTINSAKTIIDENRKLKEQLIQLQAEYSQKINMSNQLLMDARQKASEYHNDARFLKLLARYKNKTITPQEIAEMQQLLRARQQQVLQERQAVASAPNPTAAAPIIQQGVAQ
jgi:hypothetical protein